jgi:hypothetical protein
MKSSNIVAPVKVANSADRRTLDRVIGLHYRRLERWRTRTCHLRSYEPRSSLRAHCLGLRALADSALYRFALE